MDTKEKFMIDPMRVTNYERGKAQLEAFWTFCIVVAGRNSEYAARVVSDLLRRAMNRNETPFEWMRELGPEGIRSKLVAHKAGQYTRISRALVESLSLDLGSCTLDELEGIHGVGPKTARFFLLHTRKDVEHVVLDTHVIKWLARMGVDVPRKIYANKDDYRFYEAIAISLYRSHFPMLSLAEADLLVWSTMSGRIDPAGEEAFDMAFPFETREGVDE